MGSPLPITIGLNGRFFPNNWRPAREEIAFAQAHGFDILQIRGPEEGLGERHLGEGLEEVAEKLQAANLTATMEILIHVSDTPLPEVNHHLPLGLGTIDYSSYSRALLQGGFHGQAILEIGGQPKSGGFGRDTDAALVDSQQRFRRAIREAHRRCAIRPEDQI
jgi:sugar phosphate isomerase/epimerase